MKQSTKTLKFKFERTIPAPPGEVYDAWLSPEIPFWGSFMGSLEMARARNTAGRTLIHRCRNNAAWRARWNAPMIYSPAVRSDAPGRPVPRCWDWKK